MSVYLNEEEQAEMIRKWWNKYGNAITTLVLLAALSLVAWHWWEARHDKIAGHASIIYEQMLIDSAKKDRIGVIARANTLMKEYTNKPYAALAALMLARNSVDEGK